MRRQSVSVSVDVHEPVAIREVLGRLGAFVEVVALPIGDYRAGRALVERKTVNDLHRTVAAGRFFGQLGRLRAASDRAVLLVEGLVLDAGPISPAAVRGALLAAPSATSEAALAAIPGLSAVSARALLERFGSLERIVQATDVDLADVYGIGPVRAQAIRGVVTHRHAAYRSRRSRERQDPAT